MKTVTSILNNLSNGEIMILIMLVVFLLLMLVLITLALKLKRQKQEEGTVKKGSYINRGMITFMPLGFAISIPIGIATGKLPFAIAFGPAIGLFLGALFGAKWEKKHEDELAPLNENEIKFKKIAQSFLLGLFVLGVILFLLFYYLT